MALRLLGCPGAPKSDRGGSGVTARAQHLYPRVSQRAQKRLSAALSSCAFPLRARTSHRLLSFRRAIGFAFGNLVLKKCSIRPPTTAASCLLSHLLPARSTAAMFKPSQHSTHRGTCKVEPTAAVHALRHAPSGAMG